MEKREDGIHATTISPVTLVSAKGHYAQEIVANGSFKVNGAPRYVFICYRLGYDQSYYAWWFLKWPVWLWLNRWRVTGRIQFWILRFICWSHAWSIDNFHGYTWNAVWHKVFLGDWPGQCYGRDKYIMAVDPGGKGDYSAMVLGKYNADGVYEIVTERTWRSPWVTVPRSNDFAHVLKDGIFVNGLKVT